MESVKAAKEKNLSLVAGFCWRYEGARREFYQRIHEGAIGDIRAIYATYYAGQVKPMPPASERPAGMGDLEWQLRNWYNFTWLSGDGYVEQACHSVDKVAWALKDESPLNAVAVGGRQTPNNQGDIFDHMFVVYEFPDDVRGFVGQRQIGNTYTDNSDYLMGSRRFRQDSGVGGAVHQRQRELALQGARRPTCTRTSTTNCSPAFAAASRSTTASGWRTAR